MTHRDGKRIMKLDQVTFKKHISYFIDHAIIDTRGEKSGVDTKYKTQPYDIGWLARHNEAGHAIYYAVNEFDGRRKKDRLYKLRAAFLDDDATLARQSFPLEPSIIVNSSPGKYQYLWLLCDEDGPGIIAANGEIDRYEAIQNSLVVNHNGDKQARDICRVLRVPGSIHWKGDPFQVKVVGGNYKYYTLEEVERAFPAVEGAQLEVIKSEYSLNNSDELEALIIAGKDRHGGILTYALKHANIGDIGEEECVGRVCWLLDQSPHDDGYQGNLLTYEKTVQDAYKKVKDNPDITHVAGSIPKVKDLKAQPPSFPVDWMRKLPDPWPMYWNTFDDGCIYTVDQFLVNTILAVKTNMLKGRYRSEHNTLTNLCFLGFGETGGFKDVNSTGVIKHMAAQWEDSLHNPFSAMVSTTTDFSAKSNMLQHFEHVGYSAVMVDTEANYFLAKMIDDRNPHSHSMNEVLLKIAEGAALGGIKRSSVNIEGCLEPNIQFLLFSQPDRAKDLLTERNIETGWAPRFIFSLSDQTRYTLDLSYTDLAGNQTPASSKYTDFINSNIFAKHPERMTCQSSVDPRNLSALIATDDIIMALSKDNSLVANMLNRTMDHMTQLYAIVLGHMRMWDEYCEHPIRESFDMRLLMPFIEYQIAMKVYLLSEMIETTADPIRETCIEVMVLALNAEKRYGNDGIPRGVYVNRLNKKCKRLGYTKESFRVVRDGTIDGLIREGVFVIVGKGKRGGQILSIGDYDG